MALLGLPIPALPSSAPAPTAPPVAAGRGGAGGPLVVAAVAGAIAAGPVGALVAAGLVYAVRAKAQADTAARKAEERAAAARTQAAREAARETQEAAQGRSALGACTAGAALGAKIGGSAGSAAPGAGTVVGGAVGAAVGCVSGLVIADLTAGDDSVILTGAGAAWASGDVGRLGETALYCAPWDEWGGWTDREKIDASRTVYFERWGRTAGPAFEEAVRERNPCKRAHAVQLAEKYRGR